MADRVPEEGFLYTQADSSFEVHAEAYFHLRKEFVCRAGVQTYRNYDCAVFDVVIFNTDLNPVLIVEVKVRKDTKSKAKQLDKYKRVINIPVLLIKGMEQAKNSVQIVREFLRKSNV